MTIPTHQFEAKVRAVTRRTNKSGDWWSVTLEVQPHDFDEALCTMAQAQQRVQAVLAAIGDNEQPVEVKPARKPATTRAEKARRLCGVMSFQDFMLNRGQRHTWPPQWGPDEKYKHVSLWVKHACNVETKNDLDPPFGVNVKHYKPAKAWDALLAEYEQQTGRMAERHG